MKRLSISLLIILFLGLAGNTYAEKFYVYDGSTFNVMLTCDDGNTVIQKVSFSANNKWNEFAIVCSTNLGEKNGSGFVYTVLDANGVPFSILYFRDKDSIKVTNAMTGDVWTLNRRKI